MPDALRFLILTAAGWVNRHQEDMIDYLREENRVLREQRGPRPLRLTDVPRQVPDNTHRPQVIGAPQKVEDLLDDDLWRRMGVAVSARLVSRTSGLYRKNAFSTRPCKTA